jgi:predicted TIM-barrel fold metal-dependent hydrolase
MIIDAHHHIWRKNDLPWLRDEPQPRIFGEYASIRRDYPIEEYLADIQAQKVEKSVYVQTNWTPSDGVKEVAWVQSEADRSTHLNAIVGYADLGSPKVEETLAEQRQFNRFRGIRQQLHWHTNSQYRFASRPDLMNDSGWRRGFSLLEKFGLIFELQIFAHQMRDGAALAAAFPGITIVLEHAGMLEDRSREGWERWREGMRQLAKERNVHVKLSGLGTFERTCSKELMRPVILETVEMFGPNRCMFGSNFPIEKIWTNYAELLTAYQSVLADFSWPERNEIMGNTAATVYSL